MLCARLLENFLAPNQMPAVHGPCGVPVFVFLSIER